MLELVAQRAHQPCGQDRDSIAATLAVANHEFAAVQIEIGDDETLPARAATACREAGVLTRAMGGGALQVSPPFTMTSEQVDEMAGLFRAGLETL